MARWQAILTRVQRRSGGSARDPPLGGLDKANQILDVLGAFQLRADFGQGFRDVELGAQQEPEGALDLLHALPGKAVALQSDGVDAVTLRFPRRDRFRKRSRRGKRSVTASTPSDWSATAFPGSACRRSSAPSGSCCAPSSTSRKPWPKSARSWKAPRTSSIWFALSKPLSGGSRAEPPLRR